MRTLSNGRPDLAVLDVNLGIGSSIPVARELARLGIPFIFATGYGDSTQIPSDLKSQPVLRKPYEATHLLDALAKLRA